MDGTDAFTLGMVLLNSVKMTEPTSLAVSKKCAYNTQFVEPLFRGSFFLIRGLIPSMAELI